MSNNQCQPQPEGPFHRLPAEITTEIFKQAIWVDIGNIHNTIKHPRRVQITTPWTLRAVCTSWRDLVCDSPSMWTIIIMELTERYIEQIRILKVWLARSGTYPLDIWFIPSNPTVIGYNPSLHALCMLVDESWRWRKVNSVVTALLVEAFTPYCRNTPLLEAIHINWRDYHGSHPYREINMLEDAPRLQSVSFYQEISHYGAFRYIILPWKDLTSFHGKVLSTEDCIKVLSQCSNLVECTFTVTEPGHSRPGYTSNLDTIIMPHLRSLNITHSPTSCAPDAVELLIGDSHWGLGFLLEHLSCPELRQLYYSNRNIISMELMYGPLECFITNSNCDLEVLHLDNVYVLSPVLHMLELLPSLQSLILHCGKYNHYDMRLTSNHKDTDSFFNLLLEKLDLSTTDRTPFLANLTELRCKIHLPLPSSPPLPTSHNLLKVLQQRHDPPDGVSVLQIVVIEDTLPLDLNRDEGVIEGLRELERKGMRITVPEPSYTDPVVNVSPPPKVQKKKSVLSRFWKFNQRKG